MGPSDMSFDAWSVSLPSSPRLWGDWQSALSQSSGWQTFALLALLLNILLITLLIILLVYRTIIYPNCLSPLRHLPGPKDNVFLLGQTHKFIKTTCHQLFVAWSREWPDTPFIRYFGIGHTELLLASNLTSYKEILKTKNSCFVKPDLTRQTAGMIVGDGLPFAEGHAHRQRRAVLMKPFSNTRVKSLLPVLRAKGQRLVRVLADNRNALGEVEAESFIWKAVLDVISVETLGVDLNHLESDESPLHNLFGKTMQQSPLSHMINYLNCYLPSCLPIRTLIPIKANSDFLHNSAEIRDFLRGHVLARRQAWQNLEKPNGEPDALQCMVDTGYALWDDVEIVEYVLNLMVLGHDTTACSLVWAVAVLARRTDLQERLRAEVLNLGQTSETVSYSDIERLPFLDNFVREVLRVFCPVAFIPRMATVDVEVAGVLLPKGTIVQLSPGIMNLNTSIWGDDAAEFKPDRWNNLEGEASSAYAFESFHNGPRMCLGKQLSLLEMKVMLMELVMQFQVESLDGDKELEYASPSFTLRPKDRLRVKLVEL